MRRSLLAFVVRNTLLPFVLVMCLCFLEVNRASAQRPSCTQGQSFSRGSGPVRKFVNAIRPGITIPKAEGRESLFPRVHRAEAAQTQPHQSFLGRACANCTTCATNGCTCFGSGYYCCNSECPVKVNPATATPALRIVGYTTVCDGQKCYQVPIYEK